VLVHGMTPARLKGRIAAEPSQPPPIAAPERLQYEPASDIARFKAQKQQLLHGYGWVDRAHGIAHIPTGIPASAKISIASTVGSSQCSGEIEHWKFDRIGRARSSSAPPAITRHISTSPFALKGSIAVICMMCLLVACHWACVSCIGRTITGLSFAAQHCHWIPTCGRASATVVNRVMSSLAEYRRCRVSMSQTWAGQPSVVGLPLLKDPAS